MTEIKNYFKAGIMFAILSIANLSLAVFYIPVISENKIEFMLNLLIGVLTGSAALSFFIAHKKNDRESTQ